MALKYLYAPSGVQAEKAYGVLPNSANADFSSFSRNSAGSRVDKNGFINTGFGLGSEEVTNGDFDTDSDWVKGTGWTIANGVAINQGNNGSQQILQTGVVSSNKSYEMTITVVSNEGTGNNTIYIGNKIVSNTNLGVGTYTFQATPTSGSTINIFCSSGGEFSIDNVSVREITEVNTNVPRLDYTGGGCPSLLLERTSTNYVEYSEDFTQSSWSKISSGTGTTPIVTANYAISPSGELNASRIQFDKGSGTTQSDISILADFLTVPSGIDATKSIYLKSATSEEYDLVLYGTSDASGSNVKKIRVTTEWQRFDVFKTLTGTSTGIAFGLREISVSGLSNTADVLAWGAQVEPLSYTTSYIPNYGTTAGVTRSADIGGSTGDIGSLIGNEGVFEFTTSLFDLNSEIILCDGTDNNRMTFRNYAALPDKINISVKEDNSPVIGGDYTFDSSAKNKFQVFFGNGKVEIKINDALVDSENVNTNFSGKLNIIRLANASGTTNHFKGRINEIKIYDRLTL